MKVLFTWAILLFATNSFCQTYAYVEPDPQLEKEKSNKETFFKNQKDNAFTKLQVCTKQCGSYAADANNPKDPCTLPGVTPTCICNCQKTYEKATRDIEQQEKTWRADFARRQKDYENQQKQKQALNNQLKPNRSNDIIDGSSTKNNITSTQYQNSQVNNSATGATQKKTEAITNAGNAVIGAAVDIYSTVQANKQRKEDYWNSLTPEEQQEIREANRKADSTKWANKQANDKEEVSSIANRHFSIGIYGALESRDFIAELSEFKNQDGYGSTQPILSNIKKPTGYNVGLNFEWAVDAFGVGDKTRRGLFSIGLYYVTYSSPMVINQNYDPTITFAGNVAMLKFQSMRISPTLSVRLFRLGTVRALSGVFFQWGLKADYMFSATAKPVSFDSDANTTGYKSLSTTYNIADHFKKLEYGMICGLRLDLSRHFSFNVQYDVLGGLNDKILKSKYADNSDWYTFKQKNKVTGGIGIYF